MKLYPRRNKLSKGKASSYVVCPICGNPMKLVNDTWVCFVCGNTFRVNKNAKKLVTKIVTVKTG